MIRTNMIVERLQKGETVTWRPQGNSMTPRIRSGEQVTVEPITKETTLEVNDVVYAKVAGDVYLHLISAIENENSINVRYQISNNHGHTNGWTSRDKIYGKLINICP
jgi:phage repressor protein C with HTH and peptisase S24 domain